MAAIVFLLSKYCDNRLPRIPSLAKIQGDLIHGTSPNNRLNSLTTNVTKRPLDMECAPFLLSWVRPSNTTSVLYCLAFVVPGIFFPPLFLVAETVLEREGILLFDFLRARLGERMKMDAR